MYNGLKNRFPVPAAKCNTHGARRGGKILLARHLVLKLAKEKRQNIAGFTSNAVSSMESYSWPGNIREMENTIKWAVVMADGKHITCEELGLEPGDQLTRHLRQVRLEAEKNAVLRAVAMTDNNISVAARLLGVTRPTFYDLLKKCDNPIASRET